MIGESGLLFHHLLSLVLAGQVDLQVKQPICLLRGLRDLFLLSLKEGEKGQNWEEAAKIKLESGLKK